MGDVEGGRMDEATFRHSPLASSKSVPPKTNFQSDISSAFGTGNATEKSSENLFDTFDSYKLLNNSADSDQSRTTSSRSRTNSVVGKIKELLTPSIPDPASSFPTHPHSSVSLHSADSSGSDEPLLYTSESGTEEELILADDAKEGLFNVRAIVLLFLWYFFSFCTLFLNKYILSFLHGEPTLLGAIQMCSTTFLGFVQMYVPCGLYKPVERKGKPPGFFRNMILVGSMRFFTVVSGLIALKYISVSFTETVKSTAPLFTVLVAWLILGEYSGPFVILSLIPVMGGLALCTAYELSFNIIGFSAALANNGMDCLQNVFSKLLISGDEYRYTPAELQFYTSVAAIVVQIPASFVVMDIDHALSDLSSSALAFAYIMNGVCFHLQSITAYALMGYISPVTHSVANTAKRAILIWLSVLVFSNDVSLLSAAGTVIVFVGVLLYNRARYHEDHIKASALSSGTHNGGKSRGILSMFSAKQSPPPGSPAKKSIERMESLGRKKVKIHNV